MTQFRAAYQRTQNSSSRRGSDNDEKTVPAKHHISNVYIGNVHLLYFFIILELYIIIYNNVIYFFR